LPPLISYIFSAVLPIISYQKLDIVASLLIARKVGFAWLAPRCAIGYSGLQANAALAFQTQLPV
jgi:hypothetical protein